MKIVFDSNVWQIIAIPDNQKYSKEKSIADFGKIRQAIIEKKIEAYLSESIFTIEAIPKNERQDFFSSQKLKIEYKDEVFSNSVNTDFIIGPEKGIDLNNNTILKTFFYRAIELGFRIIRLPRIAVMQNEEINDFLYTLKDEEFSKYFEKATEVSIKIAEKGAGISQIEKIGKSYNPTDWMKGLRNVPKTKHKIIEKAIAEWADGDSVALCIGLECDYFCTRDQAKKAGMKSVLSSKNVQWLEKDYGFKTISPEELAKICG